MNAIIAQTRMELLLTMRRFEGVLITLIVPAVLLIFFGAVGVKPDDYDRAIDFLLPGMLALAVMSTGLVSLSIRTAYERHYGVLKRLGSTPLSRAQLLTAKVISVVVIELFEIVLLVALAAGFYDWRPGGAFGLAILTVVLGTATFSLFGLMLAGAVRAETTLATANALYLLFLLLGGIVYPISRLPGLISIPARLLPSSAFADALRASLGESPNVAVLNLIILAAWGVLALIIASRTFRWE